MPVARLRPDVLRHAQEDPHGPVRIHPGLAALLQLNGPDPGPGPLQDPFQALSPLQIAAFLQLPEQIAPLQRGYDKVRRRLEHIRRVFQRLSRGIVHAVKADDLFPIVQGDHHKGVDALPRQLLVLKGLHLPNILHVLNDDMSPNAEILIPTGAYLRGDILKVLLFRLHAIRHPLIGVVVAAGLVLLKYIGPLPLQGFPQVLQQYLKGLIRGLRQQSDTKALVDDGLQILNALHAAVLLVCLDHRSAFSGQQTFPCMIHIPVLRFLLTASFQMSENS